MNIIRNMKIGVKLPIAIVGLSVATAAVTGILAYKSSRAEIVTAAEERLTAVVSEKADTIEGWMTAIEADLAAQRVNPTVLDAVVAFDAAYNAIETNPVEYLQDQYITSNPFPTGEKERLDAATDGSGYSDVHGSYHPYFRTFLQENGYYDVFLFNGEGDLVYSVFKELDYATNLVRGEWASSDLGRAFREARQNARTGDTAFIDFAPYAPSHGAPASFISAPLRGPNGEFLGVLAFQMPVDTLNAVFASRFGLGETGQSYVVGKDGLMRNNSVLRDEPTLLAHTVKSAAVESALSGEVGVQSDNGAFGEPVLSAFRSVNIGGERWAIVTEQTVSELMAPAVALRNSLFVQVALFSLLVGGAGVFMAQSFSRPLSRLSALIGRLAEREYHAEEEISTANDEIGEISQRLETLRGDLLQAEEVNKVATFKGAAFDRATTATMMVDTDFIVTFANESTMQLFKDHEAIFKTHFPSFNADNIIGSCIDVFHKNPSHQRTMLKNPANLPFQTDIDVKPLKIALNVTGIYGPDGEVNGWMLEWEDVTAQRSGSGILSAIDQSQAVIEFELDGTIISANKNFLSTIGYTLDEIVGQHHSMFMPEEQFGTSEYRDHWERLNRGDFVGGLFERVGKGGKKIIIDAFYCSVLDRKGRPYKVVKVASDVTKTQMDLKETKAAEIRQQEVQRTVVSTLGDALRRLSTGDLESAIAEEFPSDYEQVRQNFNETVRSLQDVVGTLSERSRSMQHGVGEIAQAADDLSRRTESQAASLEETAAALDEATTSVKETASAASDANRLVMDTTTEAQASGETVRQAVEAMSAIEKSSGEISQIISVIDEIAFQTNLLALNAGVEAARAGDAGRGFAVVASEVRALAQRSSDAAREIKTLILASTEHVGSGVELVGKAGSVLERINVSVAEVSTLVSTIATSAQEQSRGLQEINTAVNQMDQVTQQNAAMVEETTAASHSLNEEAAELLRVVNHFRVDGSGSVAGGSVSTAAAPVRSQQKRVASYAATAGNTALADNEEWDDF